MEPQPDLLAAADALRTWVRTQRSAWADPSTDWSQRTTRVSRTSQHAAFTGAGSASAHADVRSPEPANAGVPRPYESLSGIPSQVAEPARAPERVQRVASTFAEPTEVDAGPGEDAEPPSRTALVSRGVRRFVVGLVLVAAMAGGVVVGWPSVTRFVNRLRIGTAAFESIPDGSQVIVDGTPVGNAPLKMELTPGTHTVQFRSKDATRSQQVAIARGRERLVLMDWSAKRYGSLQVSSTPSPAKVLVDGRERGETPLTLDDLIVGSHVVQIATAEGSVRRRVDILEGRTETLTESVFPGWLKLSTTIDVTVLDGATPVQLDDTYRALLKPGAHTLRIENRTLGFSEIRQVEIEPGGTTTVAVTAQPSTLSVAGSSDADVYIDGTKVGRTPLVDFKVSLGAHDVMVVDQYGVTRHASITVTTRPAQVDIRFTRP
jgi:hypothetical protein